MLEHWTKMSTSLPTSASSSPAPRAIASASWRKDICTADFVSFMAETSEAMMAAESSSHGISGSVWTH